MATTAGKTREVLVVFHDGSKRKVGNIPTTAKITFGPVTPGAKTYDNPTALRIYTSASNQLAVFVGVREFRDLSLEVFEEKVEIEEHTEEQRGPKVATAERRHRRAVSWESA